jgi:hypothetical protein
MLLLRHRTVRTTLVLVAVGALALAAGCGSNKYEYVKNSQQKTYFKVPSTWRQVDQGSLDDFVNGSDGSAASRIKQQTVWSVAYDAARTPGPEHIFGYSSTTEPVVWAKVEQVDPTVADIVSFDALRNLVLPVTSDARQQAAQNGFPLTDFEALHDEVLTPAKGLHGVRVVYNYKMPGGEVQTFDQTALVNDNATTLYMLLLRCDARCYVDRADELQDVATSFTVRSS